MRSPRRSRRSDPHRREAGAVPERDVVQFARRALRIETGPEDHDVGAVRDAHVDRARQIDRRERLAAPRAVLAHARFVRLADDPHRAVGPAIDRATRAIEALHGLPIASVPHLDRSRHVDDDRVVERGISPPVHEPAHVEVGPGHRARPAGRGRGRLRARVVRGVVDGRRVVRGHGIVDGPAVVRRTRAVVGLAARGASEEGEEEEAHGASSVASRSTDRAGLNARRNRTGGEHPATYRPGCCRPGGPPGTGRRRRRTRSATMSPRDRARRSRVRAPRFLRRR